jgi:hypothetical protein
MRELIVCSKNRKAIDLLLARLNKGVSNPTLESFEEIILIAKESEDRISEWLPVSSHRLGARIIHQSEDRLSRNDQRNQVQVNGIFIEMERRTRGWVLTTVEWRENIGYGDYSRIFLSPAQDAMARLVFSAQYYVLDTEPNIQTRIRLGVVSS